MARNGYFDKNKDYSLEIVKAQQSGASQSVINQLREERQNKIDSKYNGRDPYQGSHDIMGNRGSSSSNRGSSSSRDTSNNYPHSANPTPIPNNTTPARPTPMGSASDYLSGSNGDYSLAIVKAQQAGASQSIISQLRQERQNKINAQYGGRDPYQGSSDIMGRDPQAPSSFRGRPDMSRRTDLAGTKVSTGDYTITYDQNGYAVGAVHDYGKSATYGIPAAHRNASQTHREMWDMAYNAYMNGQDIDWDAIGAKSHELIDYSGGLRDEAGNPIGDFSAGNEYMKELQQAFPGSANDYIARKHDQLYGPGTFADPDFRPGGPVNPDYAGRTPGAYQPRPILGLPSGGSSQFVPALPQQPVAPQPVLPQVPSGGGFDAAHGLGQAGELLLEIQRKALAEQEARFKAAYEHNLNGLREQNALMDDLYEGQRNRAAADADLERMRLNEMGLGQGLATGSYGQLALGNSQAYLGMLGDISRQEAQDKMKANFMEMDLKTQYENAIAQARAAGDSKMAEMLYAEYTRQQEEAMAAWKIQQDNYLAAMKLQAQREQAALEAQRADAEFRTRFGDFGGYQDMGYDTSAMEAGWNRLHPVRTPSPGPSAPKPPKLHFDEIKALLDEGQRSDLLLNAYKQYTGTDYPGTGPEDTPPAPLPPVDSSHVLSAAGEDLKRDLLNIPGLTATNRIAMINSAVKNGLDPEDGNALLDYFGY